MTQLKNSYEAALRLIQLSNEIEEIGTQLSRTKDIVTREILEKKMEILDNEFIKIKHNLQASTYMEKYY